MKKWAKITAGIGGGLTIALVAAGIGGVHYARPMAEVGTGYASQASCAQTYLQARGEGSPDIPEHDLTDLLSVKYHPAEGSTPNTNGNPADRPSAHPTAGSTESTIYTLFNKHAHYVDGVGCVVAKDRPNFTNTPPSDGERARIIEQSGGGIDLKPEPLNGPAQQRLDQAVSGMVDEGARGVVVMKEGHLRAEAYAATFTPDTPQLGWSMTKSLANVLAGRAVAEGKVTSITDANKSAHTLDQLMRMSSGLEWHEHYDTDGDTTEMLYRQADMGAYAAGKEQAHEPGTYREYSTGTTNILCDELQEQTGMGVDMAWELLFKPLGMGSAELAADESGGLVCGSYAYATPRDWAKLGQFVMHGGDLAKAGGVGAEVGAGDNPDTSDASAGDQRAGNGSDAGNKLLPEKWMELSLKEERDLGAADSTEWANYSAYGENPQLDDPSDAGYGASWWLNRDEDGNRKWSDLPEDMYWASGHDGQFLVVIPSEEIVIVRQGFNPGEDIESTGTINLVREVLKG